MFPIEKSLLTFMVADTLYIDVVGREFRQRSQSRKEILREGRIRFLLWCIRRLLKAT